MAHSQLGELLRRLKGVLDERFRSYFFNSLCDTLGLNLRNRALHGLWGGAGPVEVVVLLFIISPLAGLEITLSPSQQRGRLDGDQEHQAVLTVMSTPPASG